ncbi:MULTISPECIES: hypothetical protein [Streptomyces]|uniref:Uncharacterized protein n=1 Tax=Streptomyces dysideae TaxID=909626 RepID=A0A124IFQ7_9ACTN|nr:hypothetical protein [Streptomyces dysideae]KUO22190.1 hypothetical protein AQJ91_05955 [Streptomyces dysideae]
MSDHTAVILLACVLAVLVAVLVGIAAGCLARLDGSTYPAALERAALAFAAVLTLAATIASAITS